MKYYHKCITGHGTELWIRAHTWFSAAMTAFGPQGATWIRGDGKDGGRVEYSGGQIERELIINRADRDAVLLFDGVQTKPPIIAVEVEDCGLDEEGNLLHESDFSEGAPLESILFQVRSSVYLVFKGAGRDGVADFVEREDAETARDELETYFGVEDI